MAFLLGAGGAGGAGAAAGGAAAGVAASAAQQGAQQNQQQQPPPQQPMLSFDDLIGKKAQQLFSEGSTSLSGSELGLGGPLGRTSLDARFVQPSSTSLDSFITQMMQQQLPPMF